MKSWGVFAAVSGLILLVCPAAGNASDWFLVGEHYHTTTDVDFSRDPGHHDPSESYSAEGLQQLLDRGVKGGFDALIVTEHNSVATCFDPLFTRASTKVLLICGEEWTTHKSLHMGLLNPPVRAAADSYLPRDPDRERESAEVEAEARELAHRIHEQARSVGQTSLVVVNHPGFKMYQPVDALGADAAEVIVPEYESALRTRKWWLERLTAGQKLVALGGSDYHACSGWDCLKRGDYFRTLFSEPVNLVQADTLSTRDIMAAIARGRVVALSSLKYKDVRLELAASFNGRDYAMGDTIEGVSAGAAVKIQVRIRKARGLYAVVYGLGGPKKLLDPLRDRDLENDDDFAAEFEATRSGPRQAVHVELYDPNDWSGDEDSLPVAVSNPIYF